MNEKFWDVFFPSASAFKLSSGFIYYAIQGIPPLGIPTQAAAVVAADAGRPAVVPWQKSLKHLGLV